MYVHMCHTLATPSDDVAATRAAFAQCSAAPAADPSSSYGCICSAKQRGGNGAYQ